ncbi:MAG TPA: N-acetylmuramoyl-L-alanine amidase [Candidatus Binatia bacterium]|nr:N-acetylmuramoyl-L-alanine amidase [Candidatus Binatia bacterium]
MSRQAASPGRAVRGPRIALSSIALSLAVGVEVLLAGLAPTAIGATIADTVSVATAAPRVFEPNGDGVDDSTTLHVELSQPASASVTILDYAGHLVRTLSPTTAQPAGPFDVTWDGRSSPTGRIVQDAGYRFHLTVSNGLGTYAVDRWVTKAPDAIFPADPGDITVAIDPGHGGPDPGAVRPGLMEKTANLDTALRLRAMLLGAGVRVVMTRTTDRRVNTGNVDWTLDGKVAYRDELASRIEVANRARADVFMVLHNNGTPPGVRATETWYDDTRTFSATNKMLATQVQSQLIAYLRTRRTSTWAPRDRGIHVNNFYVLRQWKVHFDERPSLMPGILGESLAMGNLQERRVLESGPGRQAIAEGYYEGLVRFFRLRTWGARYTLLSGPGSSAPEGSPASTTVRVTNTSPATWAAGSVSMTLSAVRYVPWYDGTNSAGTRLATVDLPELAPGASTDVVLPFTVPAWSTVSALGGRTILKVDLLSGATRLASAGVPPLQMNLTIGRVVATPTPSPSPTPSDEPTPSEQATPSDEPTPSEQATPSDQATPADEATPTPTPTPTPTDEPTPTPTPEPS